MGGGELMMVWGGFSGEGGEGRVVGWVDDWICWCWSPGVFVAYGVMYKS